jgi:hypothetical protein
MNTLLITLSLLTIFIATMFFMRRCHTTHGWKVPFRQSYCATFRIWVAQIIYCHLVLRLMPRVSVPLLAMILVLLTAGCTALEKDITTWWENPATQAEIQAIEQVAVQVATAYLSSLVAAPAPGVVPQPIAANDPGVVAAEAAEVAALQKQYPDAPADALKSIVAEKFNAAIATHNAALPK